MVVWDGHDSSHNLSVLDIHPKALLLVGEPVSPTLELDRSYSAVIFVGQHAMAGASKAILSHSYSSEGIQNIWVNSKPVGEIGGRDDDVAVHEQCPRATLRPHRVLDRIVHSDMEMRISVPAPQLL